VVGAQQAEQAERLRSWQPLQERVGQQVRQAVTRRRVVADVRRQRRFGRGQVDVLA
jgi:hypothetical protein